MSSILDILWKICYHTVYIKIGGFAMKKRLSCIILTLVMIISLVPFAAAASDEATEAAEALYELGLFKGTGTNPDGTPIFDLDKTPTRNQAIIMLVRLLGKEEEAKAGTWKIPFTDVSDSMKPYIGYAYTNGLTNGTSATTYSGGNPIRANQYITFVLRSLGYTSGKDFAVSTAWEFSDKIGLTDERYNQSTNEFLRGDIALISYRALSINLKGTAVSLQQKLEKEKQGDYWAWYEVDDLGRLRMKTNLTVSNPKRYWVLVELHFANGSKSYDSQGTASSLVQYDFNSLLSYWNKGTVINSVDFYVYEDASTHTAFWAQWDESRGLEKSFAAVADNLIAQFTLDNSIFIQTTSSQFELTSLSINRNEEAKNETYTAYISPEILDEGEYGLVYERGSGRQNQNLTYMRRADGYLTFTREIDHFAPPGANGTFYISHNYFALSETDDIVCSVTRSTGYKYQF